MGSSELRKRFLDFFKERGHTVVPSSSLIPDDPSVLLTTAGMQQFKPYYTGAADPMKSPHPTLGGTPLNSLNAASIQKSFRTSDIDEVGDERHLTFFEMMGNFSFGGYFKEDAIKYAYDFLKEIGLNIQYVTIFEGDPKANIPKDKESKRIWESLGIKDVREAGREDNFWGPTGNEGPCGPTTEIYIGDTEIWNIVFNEYYSHPDGTLEKLKTPGVDTGMGLERLAMVSQNVPTIFETDLFGFLVKKFPTRMGVRERRIVADHIRAIAFLISDGVRPSNKEQGYILRRLTRRVIVHQRLASQGSFSGKDIISFDATEFLALVVDNYKSFYENLDKEFIWSVFNEEWAKFLKTIGSGLRELKRLENINAQSAFKLYESFGLPYEVTKELGGEKAKSLNREEFDVEFKKHQEISRAGQERKFGGHGLLLDTGELRAADEKELKIVTRLHTATHLAQAALRRVLGDTVHQAGSDITAERMRFDFTFDRKLTTEELRQVEDWVNEVVKKDVPMGFQEMPYEEAIKTGALYFAKEKYPPTVKVYSAANPATGEVYTKELCGGPHVAHTGQVGKFKILKEESVGAGLRRLRATLE